MTRAAVIARRELGSYGYSPIAYVLMVIFLLLCGVLFWNDFQPGSPAVMRTIFDWMVNILVFIIPMLGMGLLAQEWAAGTIETMMTAPISETDVVMGKFLGSFFFYAILLAPDADLCRFAASLQPSRCGPHPQRISRAAPRRSAVHIGGALFLIVDQKPDRGGGRSSRGPGSGDIAPLDPRRVRRASHLLAACH